MNHTEAIIKIIHEYQHATKIHGAFPSAHHGYAAILEELDELWDEIKKKHPDPAKLEKEAKHVTAMGLRFLVDIIPEKARENK